MEKTMEGSLGAHQLYKWKLGFRFMNKMSGNSYAMFRKGFFVFDFCLFLMLSDKIDF